MIGAIAGDMIGSIYEGKKAWLKERTPHFEPLFHPRARFTDDTVLTVAVADSILNGGDLVELLKEYTRSYPGAGYGSTFQLWAESDERGPYNSWGNGAAMRVSPVGYAYNSLDEVLLRARWTAEVTHNHRDGIRGAQATAAAVYLARNGYGREDIRDYLERKFEYDLGATLDDIRPNYKFDVSCNGTVPLAILAFLESTDYETALRLAVSLGGDTDTLACIAGAVAGAFYGVPDSIRSQTVERLDDHLREALLTFEGRFL